MIRERQPSIDPEVMGIAALQFLSSDDDLMMRFLALSGLRADELRAAAYQPGFLVGVLDFILAHEPTVMAFAEHATVSPDQIQRARTALDEHSEKAENAR